MVHAPPAFDTEIPQASTNAAYTTTTDSELTKILEQMERQIEGEAVDSNLGCFVAPSVNPTTSAQQLINMPAEVTVI